MKVIRVKGQRPRIELARVDAALWMRNAVAQRRQARGRFCGTSRCLRCVAAVVAQAVPSVVQHSHQLQTGRQRSRECNARVARVVAARYRTPEPESQDCRRCTQSSRDFLFKHQKLARSR